MNNAKMMAYVQDVGGKLKTSDMFTVKDAGQKWVNGDQKSGKILIAQIEYRMGFAIYVGKTW